MGFQLGNRKCQQQTILNHLYNIFRSPEQSLCEILLPLFVCRSFVVSIILIDFYYRTSGPVVTSLYLCMYGHMVKHFRSCSNGQCKIEDGCRGQVGKIRNFDRSFRYGRHIRYMWAPYTLILLIVAGACTIIIKVLWLCYNVLQCMFQTLISKKSDISTGDIFCRLKVNYGFVVRRYNYYCSDAAVG